MRAANADNPFLVQKNSNAVGLNAKRSQRSPHVHANLLQNRRNDFESRREATQEAMACATRISHQ